MSFFCRVTFCLTLMASGTVAAPSEMDGLLMSKNYEPRANEVRDSPLERVQVRQETGFDGRVRSIRFSLEPDQNARDEGAKQRLYSRNNFNSYPIRATYNQNIGLPTMQMIQTEDAPEQLPLFESTPPMSAKASRSKRETEKNPPNNAVDDLETAEAKVFRPLFVYRQQVSRRLQLQNDRQSNKNRRLIRSRARPRFSSYYYPSYYPYQYSPGYAYYY